MFFNEFDLLEIRLNYLNSVVDKFVLVEMNQTISGNKKPLYFEENKDRFKEFLDKIIHIKLTECPDFRNYSNFLRPWATESYQRDSISLGLKDAKEDDIIMVSDVDEIPSVEGIQSYDNGIQMFAHKMRYYYLNMMSEQEQMWLKGTKICHYSDMLHPTYTTLAHLGIMQSKPGSPNHIRYYYDGKIIYNGGWHFSFMGGINAIAYKIQSYPHQEFNKEEIINPSNIEFCMEKGKDLFGRNFTYRILPMDEASIIRHDFPDYLVRNQEKYKHLIKPWN